MFEFKIWLFWLKLASIVTILFGAVMAFFNDFPLFRFFEKEITNIFFTEGTMSSSAIDLNTFLQGVLGSVLIGYGTSIAFIVFYGLNRKEKWAWWALLTSLLAWYITDTGVSILYGAMFNIVFNNAFFLLIIIPLLFIRKSIVKKVTVVL